MGPSPREVRGAESLKQWIGSFLTAFSAVSFATVVGPAIDGDNIAGRWVFTGTYEGGFPGSPPTAAGRRVEFAGMDLLRIEKGLIAEYWLCADVLPLLQQLGVIPS